jgi:hypothetical protein
MELIYTANDILHLADEFEPTKEGNNQGGGVNVSE